MDRNSVFGLLLIGAIIIGYTVWMQPSQKEVEAQKHKRDSIIKVEQELERQQIEQQKKAKDTTKASVDVIKQDSIQSSETKNKFGVFSQSAQGENKFVILENNLIKLKLSTLGGRIYTAQLKNYKTFDGLDLKIFDGDNNSFGFEFATTGNRVVNTSSMYFVPTTSQTGFNASTGKQSVTFRLAVEASKYIDYIYTLEPNSYMVDFKVNFVGMNDIVAAKYHTIDLNWVMNSAPHEKGRDWENNNTGLYFKYFEDDEVDNLSEMKDSLDKQLKNKAHWIAFKQQFFSAVIIAPKGMMDTKLKSIKYKQGEFLKTFAASPALVFDNKENDTIPLKFYFGPNQYSLLKSYDLHMQALVPLGWGIFGYVNRFAIIPIFNWLGSLFGSYGLIIFLLTVIIKVVLFPLTYRSYVSSAKMRVLKPQIDEINKRFAKDKMVERQQAVMALYRKVGVNPMGGCLPLLLQFPILLALFKFFPASIELRQQAFLWAPDLSAYDSIVSWSTYIPFLSNIYGNHVSLFTLLMAGSIILTSKVGGSDMGGGDANSQMPGMKWMMYMMPVMMVFWFNNYSSGLSYYYFLSNMITFGQMMVIRRYINDEDILKKLNDKKKVPAKKSNFQSRLELMAKQRGYKLPKK